MIIEALNSRFRAQKTEALAALSILINNSVSVGDHPVNQLDEAEKLVRQVVEADECINTLAQMFTQPAETEE
tara:strand:+ start:300 stop:515 length:216 start_codon:yes stop_codon:yes gene_type:complete